MEGATNNIGSQLDFVIGEPQNQPHPIEAVNDNDLRSVLSESELSDQSVASVMGHRGKFRDLLLEIYEAGLRADYGKVNILAKTLEVAIGARDPRRNEDDPMTGEGALPAHANRPWFNG